MDKKISFAEIRGKPPDGLPDVRVCDFPMGGGKTQSLIRELNMRHAEEDGFKVIVLLPRKSEDRRVRDACPLLDFVIPDRSYKNWRPVSEQTIQYMMEGRNIASTHAAFEYYRDEVYQLAKEQGYSLYIDESFEAVDADRNSAEDIRLLMNAGIIRQEEDGAFSISDESIVHDYKGVALKKIFRTFQSRGIAYMDTELHNDRKHITILWNVSPELMRQFKDVTIMTFNFYGQQLYYYCKAEGIPYRMIGVGKDGDGIEDYYFTDNPDEYHYPSYLDDIGRLVHVYENSRMQGLDYYGRKRTALSMNWFRKPGNLELVAGHADSFYRNAVSHLTADHGANRRLWSTFTEDADRMTKKGSRLSKKNFLAYNTRAVNDYSDRTLLMYGVNLFPNVTITRYWNSLGYEIDEDMYALNHMIQWIWRSAIRNGKEIWVLVPSNRMRELLKKWLDDPLRYCQVS